MVVRKTGLKSEKLDRIMGVIFENPQKEFTLREMEKLTKLPRTTVSDYLNEIKKKGILNKETILFKIKKSNYFIEKIVLSGLVDYLVEKLNPSCIILFGSIRKGESNNESDIDLFVESSLKKELNLKVFEKKLKHPIQLFVETDIKKLPENLFNNVVNGIKLCGSFKIK
jgi:predicted nucleotidyltransferase